MAILSMFSWWYTKGLSDHLGRIRRMLQRVNDQFSLRLLLKTLFQPFRQISANDHYGDALEDKIRAWFDKLVSRIIGAFIRLFTMVVGVVALFLTLILSLVLIVLWLALPVLPFLGIYLMNELGIFWEIGALWDAGSFWEALPWM